MSVASTTAIIVRRRKRHSSRARWLRKPCPSRCMKRKAVAACMFSFTLTSFHVTAASVEVATMYAFPKPATARGKHFLTHPAPP